MGRKRLTDILKEMGLVDEKQIEMALSRQHMVGARVGSQLVHLGFINEDQLAQALSKLYGVPPLTVEMLHQIDDEAREFVPRAVAEKYKILPVSKIGRKLTVAMINPGDLELIQELEFCLGARVELCVCPEVTMDLGLHMHYGIEANKEHTTLDDEKAKVQIFQAHMGCFGVPFKDDFLATMTNRMRVVKNAEEAVSFLLEEAGTVVQKVDLYLVGSEGMLKRWDAPSKDPDESPIDSPIRLSEISSLMKQMHKGRFSLGDRSFLLEPQVMDRFSTPDARKVLFVPILVGGTIFALLYADNGSMDITLSHLEDILALSDLLPLALMFELPETPERRGDSDPVIALNRRVKVTRVSDGKNSEKKAVSIVGRESGGPMKGKTYRVFTEKGSVFSTSPVLEISSKYVKTKNSVYEIEALEAAAH